MVPMNATITINTKCSTPGNAIPVARHQTCAKHQERAQIMAWRDPAHDQRQQRRSQQRGGRNDADRHGVVAQRRHIGRQDDDGEAVAEAAQASRDIEQ